MEATRETAKQGIETGGREGRGTGNVEQRSDASRGTMAMMKSGEQASSWNEKRSCVHSCWLSARLVKTQEMRIGPMLDCQESGTGRGNIQAGRVLAEKGESAHRESRNARAAARGCVIVFNAE